jgi:hypothetical protein
LGAAVLPLSITEDAGLAQWMWWVTDPFWFWTGLIALVVGIVWAGLGVHSRKSETTTLRQEVSAVKSSAAELAASAATRASADIVHQLAPIVHDLGTLVDSKQAIHGGTLIDRCLNAVIKIIGVEDARACLYYLDQVESDEADSYDILDALALRMPAVGRQDDPRMNFIRGEGTYADDLFKVIDSGAPRLVDDVDKPEYDLDCAGRKYKTFMNVAVKFKTIEMGILSVDAPKAGSLTDSHVLLARMIASILAIGMRREKKRNSGRNPTPGTAIGNAPVNPYAGDNA